jgi:cell division septation protein DedD
MPADVPPLGSTVRQTYDVLTSPCTTTELAVVRGVSTTTIRRHLAILRQHGLVATVSKPGARNVWARSEPRASTSTAVPARTPPVAHSATEQAPAGSESKLEPNPEPTPQAEVETAPKPDRNVIMLGIVGVLIGAVIMAVALGHQKSSSAHGTPASSNVSSSSPTFASATPTTATAPPSVPSAPPTEVIDDLKHRGSLKIGGRTFTQAQARGYLARLRQVLASPALDPTDLDSDLLSIGAGVCNDLEAGRSQRQEIDALQLVLDVEPVDAHRYFSVAVGKLCADSSAAAAGDHR